MKSVLCFGDSNTYGVNPDTQGRWPREVRWTGILQKLLGPEYYVIEEGYNGRTTVPTDHSDMFRSGIDGIQAVMKTHSPVDLVIMMLGTNDLHMQYATNAKLSADDASRVIKKMRGWCHEAGQPVPQVLVVSPIHTGKNVGESRFWGFPASAYEESLKFAEWYGRMAEMNGCSFFDAATVADPGSDELHMDSKSHKALAEALAVKVKEILG